MTEHDQLSRRERQIMDILYECGEATAADVRQNMIDAPSYSTVRALLSKLETKGHIQHQERGPRYVFSPVVPRSAAGRSAIGRLVKTFFGGSAAQAVTGLLGHTADDLSDQELDELARQIDEARRQRKQL